MSTLLLDSSVWLASARPLDEPDHRAATAILGRRASREVELRILDLTLYEVANVVLRKWRRPASYADRLVTTVLDFAGVPPLIPSADERRSAWALAETHGLSGYDASYAAVASARGLTLVSGDLRLIEAGLADAPGDV